MTKIHAWTNLSALGTRKNDPDSTSLMMNLGVQQRPRMTSAQITAAAMRRALRLTRRGEGRGGCAPGWEPGGAAVTFLDLPEKKLQDKGPCYSLVAAGGEGNLRGRQFM